MGNKKEDGQVIDPSIGATTEGGANVASPQVIFPELLGHINPAQFRHQQQNENLPVNTDASDVNDAANFRKHLARLSNRAKIKLSPEPSNSDVAHNVFNPNLVDQPIIGSIPKIGKVKHIKNRVVHHSKLLVHPKTIAGICAVALVIATVLTSLNYQPKKSSILRSKQTQIFGISIANLDKAATLKKLGAVASAQQISLNIDGKIYKYTAKDLGVTRDVSEVVDAAFPEYQSKINSLVFRQKTDSKVRTFINRPKLVATIESKLGQYKLPENATVRIDGANVVVQPGKAGMGIDFKDIESKISNSDFTEKLAISADLTKREPDIGINAANAAKAKADAFIARTYAVDSKTNGIRYASAFQKVTWIRFTNTVNNTIDMTIDIGAAKNTLTQIAKSFAQSPRDKVTLSINGSPPTVLDNGQDGISVDQNSIASSLSHLDNAFSSGQGFTATVVLFKAPAGSRNLGSVNGGRFILVDLSEYKAFAIDNSTVARSMLVSTGMPNMPTPTGQFKIRSKVSMTTMRGCNTAVGCWSVPNIPNVQFFTSEGHAFHGTYWHNDFGKANRSHGCINLTLGDAEWLYGWTVVGTDIIIIQ